MILFEGWIGIVINLMTLAVASYYPDRVRCALDVVGPSNLVTFLENTAAYRRDLRRAEYGDEREPRMREFLNRTVSINNAARITKPSSWYRAATTRAWQRASLREWWRP